MVYYKQINITKILTYNKQVYAISITLHNSNILDIFCIFISISGINISGRFLSIIWVRYNFNYFLFCARRFLHLGTARLGHQLNEPSEVMSLVSLWSVNFVRWLIWILRPPPNQTSCVGSDGLGRYFKSNENRIEKRN